MYIYGKNPVWPKKKKSIPCLGIHPIFTAESCDLSYAGKNLINGIDWMRSLMVTKSKSDTQNFKFILWFLI